MLTSKEQNFGILYNAFLIIGTEMVGYGLAGMCRRWLVYPSDMIWPMQLQTCAFLNTLHKNTNPPAGRWTISRYRLFVYALVAMFLWTFVPRFIPFLSHMDIFCIMWPKSKIVNTLFGYNWGLALLPLSLSYQTVICFLGTPFLFALTPYIGAPQIVPVIAHVNIFAGMAFWFWLVSGIMLWRNHWNSQYFPVGS
jgi:OPT oligopeptide transporter protein